MEHVRYQNVKTLLRWVVQILNSELPGLALWYSKTIPKERCYNICKKIKMENSRYMQYISAIIATFSMAIAASYVMWASPSLPKLMSPDSPIGTTLTPGEASWVASSFLLGSIPGSTIAGVIVERLGRRKSLLLSGIPLFVPWIVIIFAKSAITLIIARVVAGMGGGIAFTVSPMYNGEIAENDIRGKLGILCNLLMNAGGFFVLSVGPFVSYTALALSYCVFSLVFLILCYFIPESPYYLIKTGRHEAARKNLIRLSSSNVEDELINIRLKEIENTVQEDMKQKSTLWEFLSKQDYRMSLIIMFGVTILQQFSGATAMDSYMQTIIQSTNSSITPEVSSIIYGFLPIPAVLIAATLVDKMGRKPLLIISALGCAVALTAEGIYFYLQDVVKGNLDSILWLPTTGLIFFQLMNHTGLYTLPYVLWGEIFSTNIKGIAGSVTTIYGASLSFLVIKFFEPISKAWGMYTMFWIFAGVCILGSVFVLVVLPETKGKTFLEIQKKLNTKRNISYKV